jgi:perosamine synthetase
MSAVREFEKAFAERVNARWAVATTNGTATIEVGLRALGINDEMVVVPPLTHAATTIAVLNSGNYPLYSDIDDRTWLMHGVRDMPAVPVSLYGLHYPAKRMEFNTRPWIDDAAQTLRPHSGHASFTSYSLQKTKIISTQEGGVLVTNDDHLAERARSIASLGYDLKADQPHINKADIKAPDYPRHHQRHSLNARMNEVTAELGLRQLRAAEAHLSKRQVCANYYREAVEGCSWIVPQHAFDGWHNDFWAYTVALESKGLWRPFVDAIVRQGGEHPFGAWRLTYDESPFAEYRPAWGCPNAQLVQPRLVQFQTNDLASAERNAKAVRKAIQSMNIEKIVREHTSVEFEEGDFDVMGRFGDATGTPCS